MSFPFLLIGPFHSLPVIADSLPMMSPSCDALRTLELISLSLQHGRLPSRPALLLGLLYTVRTFFYDSFSSCDVTHWMSEEGNGETSPSRPPRLVGNFPCMPPSPAFTYPLSHGDRA